MENVLLHNIKRTVRQRKRSPHDHMTVLKPTIDCSSCFSPSTNFSPFRAPRHAVPGVPALPLAAARHGFLQLERTLRFYSLHLSPRLVVPGHLIALHVHLEPLMEGETVQVQES